MASGFEIMNPGFPIKHGNDRFTSSQLLNFRLLFVEEDRYYSRLGSVSAFISLFREGRITHRPNRVDFPSDPSLHVSLGARRRGGPDGFVGFAFSRRHTGMKT